MLRVCHGTGKTCPFFQIGTTWEIYQNMFSQREFGSNTGKMLEVFKVTCRRYKRFVVGCCCNLLAFVGNFELRNIPVIEWGYCIRFHCIFDCSSEGLQNSFLKNGLVLYRKVKRLSLVLHLWYMKNCAHDQSDDLDVIISNRMKYGIHNGRTLQ